MATARITYTWTDGARAHMTIDVDPSFPDAIDEARTQVTRMFRDVCITADADEDAGDG